MPFQDVAGLLRAQARPETEYEALRAAGATGEHL